MLSTNIDCAKSKKKKIFFIMQKGNAIIFFNFTAETHKCSKIEPEALYIIIITKNNSIFVVYGEKN